MKPIKDEVHAIVDAQAAKGLAKYKRLLDGTPTNRSSLRDMAEEAVDLAHYALDADRQIRALMEYVARLEGALREIAGPQNEPDANGLIEDWTCCYCDENSLDGCAENCPRTIAAAALATSPLAGQPQPAPASPWRPIAEAKEVGLHVVGGYFNGAWSESRVSMPKHRAIAFGYTHYHPISAPPQEGE